MSTNAPPEYGRRFAALQRQAEWPARLTVRPTKRGGAYCAAGCHREGVALTADESDYRLSQLRYDLAKLRANGLVQRLGRTRRYRLTPAGAKLGVLFVKLRIRLLGPLATLATQSGPQRPPIRHTALDAAFHEVDTALDHICVALGLQRAA